MNHQVQKRPILRVRHALIVVPPLVAVPDRAEEELVDAAALVEIGARVAVQIAGQLLDDDEVGQRLLVEPLAPAVLRILVVRGVERLLGLAYEVGDIGVLFGLALVVLWGICRSS